MSTTSSFPPPPPLLHRLLLHRLLPPLSATLSLLALAGGINGLLRPTSFASTFGIPLPSSSSSSEEKTRDRDRDTKQPAVAAALYASALASRNVSSGLLLLTLLYRGWYSQGRLSEVGGGGGGGVVGAALLCGVVATWADAWACWRWDGWEGKAVGHAVMGGVVGLVGGGMVWLGW